MLYFVFHVWLRASLDEFSCFYIWPHSQIAGDRHFKCLEATLIDSINTKGFETLQLVMLRPLSWRKKDRQVPGCSKANQTCRLEFCDQKTMGSERKADSIIPRATLLSWRRNHDHHQAPSSS
uniref:Uncharacterized protein n=1 Tax=Physcomitrium patens TaxID=3218 RepID=A0A2K1K8C6_PHYPA|nr:hypothetical protein PHYPA_011927 [Physcomitrium patens]